MSLNEYLVKICVMGSADVKKTSLIRRFAEGKFETNYLPTLGVDITTKKIQVDDNQVKLILVDTAGQEFFGKLRPSYYSGASAAMIVFNKGNRESFEAIGDWIREFRSHIPDNRIPIGIVGLIKETAEVTQKEGRDLANKINMRYYETKINNDRMIETIFSDLVKGILYRRFIQGVDRSDRDFTHFMQFLSSKVRKLSIIEYWGERTVVFCEYRCQEIPKYFKDRIREKEQLEQRLQGFVEYPERHNQWCGGCPFLDIIVDRKPAQMIIEGIENSH